MYVLMAWAPEVLHIYIPPYRVYMSSKCLQYTCKCLFFWMINIYNHQSGPVWHSVECSDDTDSTVTG